MTLALRLAALSALFAPLQAVEADRARIDRLVAELDTARPDRARDLERELVALAEPAALAALGGADDPLASHSIAARRIRARIARQRGGASAITPALAALGDSDPGVRVELLRFLSSPRLRRERAGERAAAFERLARDDADSTVRAEAIEALGRLDDAAAAEALERSLDGAGGDAESAASALARHPRGGAAVVRAVQRALAPDSTARALPDSALAELLARGYGRALAEQASGGESPADRAPFALAAVHPSPDVRAAAAIALEGFADRCRSLGEVERGLRVLGALDGGGVDDVPVLFERAMLALTAASDPSPALDAARAMRRRLETRVDDRALEQFSGATLLEAAAYIAVDRPAEAEPALDAAVRALDAIAARRTDLALRGEPDLLVELAWRRALVELYRALAQLALGREAGDPIVLERARSADEFLLRAQELAARRAPARPMSVDDLLLHALGPIPLVFGSVRNRALDRSRALELERALCQACATVAGGGVPGFERPPGVADRLADPLKDERRRAALLRVQNAQHEAQVAEIEDELRRLTEPEGEERGGGPRGAGYAYDPDRARELAQILYLVKRDQERELREGHAALPRLRAPSQAASFLAERLREHGRTAAARAIAEKACSDFEGARDALGGVDFERCLARAETALGGALMDQGAAAEAEAAFTRAVERLEAIEQLVKDRGTRLGLSVVRDQLAGALVALAVNANVKQRDQEKALAYFERAFDLDQSDFMRVLLACYRARAGRTAEAWEALENAPVSPANFYNLACTYALLGERELALDFLRRDLAELRGSEGSRERQKEWARGDPDLASLRGDPRFTVLVAPGEPR